VATVQQSLGCLYRDRKQFNITQAEPLLKRALVIREKALGPEHPDTAASLSDLSLLYFYEKNFAAAEKFAQRALPIQEKVFGPNGLAVSTALNRLGIAERELGNLSAAETTLKRALAIREKNLEPNHPWIAVSLENLASVYLMQNEFDGSSAYCSGTHHSLSPVRRLTSVFCVDFDCELKEIATISLFWRLTWAL